MEMLLRVILCRGISYNGMKFRDIVSDFIILKYAFRINIAYTAIIKCCKKVEYIYNHGLFLII